MEFTLPPKAMPEAGLGDWLPTKIRYDPAMKMFVIPCEVNAQKVPVQFYIGEPTKFLPLPIHFQRAWIKQERGVDVPADVCDSLIKLKEIAEENNASFVSLCTYALNYPTDPPKVDDPTRKQRLWEEIRMSLIAAELRFSESNDQDHFLLTWTTDFGRLAVFLKVHVYDGNERIMANARLPLTVPETLRAAAVDLINRINYLITYGNFEMDVTDGVLLFRTVLLCKEPDNFLGQRWISTMVRMNVQEAIHFLPAFHALISEGASPTDAIAKATNPAS